LPYIIIHCVLATEGTGWEPVMMDAREVIAVRNKGTYHVDEHYNETLHTHTHTHTLTRAHSKVN
jgi:hypothetical protein